MTRIFLPVAAALLIAQAACDSSTPTATPIPAAPSAPTPTVPPTPTPSSLRAAHTDDFSTNYTLARAAALERGRDWDDSAVYAANYAVAHSEARARGNSPPEADAYAANYADARAAAIDDFNVASIGDYNADRNAREEQARAAAYAVNYADARAVARERGDAPEQGDLYADAYAGAMDIGYAPDRASVYANAYPAAYMDRQDAPYGHPYAYASAYAHAREREYAPQSAAVYADAYENAVRNYGYYAPQGLVYAEGYLYAAGRGDSSEEAETYASFRVGLYRDVKSEAQSDSVEEEPAQAFAFTFSRVYGEAAEREDYSDGERRIAFAVDTYTAAISVGYSLERAALYTAAYVVATARGDEPQQAVSYAVEYADANAMPVHRIERLPDTESLSRWCCR